MGLDRTSTRYPIRTSREGVRQAIATLRRALLAADSAALIVDATTVALDPAAVSTDVEQCQALLREGSPTALATAVERHAGVMLDGFDAKSPSFEQWVEEHRRAFRRELLQALERAAAHCAASGDLPGAIVVLERLVALEPTNEPYALAKITGIKMCESYRRQYGCDFRSVMPTNLYGPHDNFDAETSHVLPALLRRFDNHLHNGCL